MPTASCLTRLGRRLRRGLLGRCGAMLRMDGAQRVAGSLAPDLRQSITGSPNVGPKDALKNYLKGSAE